MHKIMAGFPAIRLTTKILFMTLKILNILASKAGTIGSQDSSHLMRDLLTLILMLLFIVLTPIVFRAPGNQSEMFKQSAAFG